MSIFKMQGNAENKITEITRQEIIDLYVHGWKNHETGEVDGCFWSGKLDETAFLSRLFDLDSMQSTDRRYRNAYNDIQQHRVRNTDWEDDWVFHDSRFRVKFETDEKFMTFVCETFHPAVRNELCAWEVLLDKINKLLRTDGFEIYQSTSISGRDVFSWKQIAPTNSIQVMHAEHLTTCFDTEYMHQQIGIMNRSIDTYPLEAIGKSKELVETCCKAIMEDRGLQYEGDWPVTRLSKEVCGALRLTPEDIADSTAASNTIRKLLGSLGNISQSLAELRNDYGSGHGRTVRFKGMLPRHARLAVGVASSYVLFLWETHKEQMSQ